MQFRLNDAARLAGAVALALALAGCSQEGSADADGKAATPGAESQAAEKSVKTRHHRLTKGTAKGTAKRRLADKSSGEPKAKPPVVDVDERTDLSPADRETMKLIEKAMEDEDVAILRKAIPAAVKSPTAEVRSDAVDALGWFGEKTMEDLLPFMADGDADIAESALNHWTSALGEIESEKRRCDLVESVMKVLTNEDALESLVTELSNCDDLLAMQATVRLIGCENPAAVKVAREHYEFMTGDEFTTIEAAEAWAAENCAEEGEEN